MDNGLLLLIAFAVTAVLWVAAFALRRVDVRVTLQGLRNGALIAAALFALTVIVVTLMFNGRAVFAEPLDLAGAFGLGLQVGAVVAVGYVWLGAALIAIGLLFRSKPLWSTLGAWVAVPIIVVSLGFGYVSYRSVSADAQQPTANGSISISLSNGQRVVFDANGSAMCTTDASGTTVIRAGTAGDPHLVSGDGRLISATVTMNPDAQGAALDLSVAGLDTSDMTTETEVASGPRSGQLLLNSAIGTGTLTWLCSG
jgi:hypothetical protein